MIGADLTNKGKIAAQVKPIVCINNILSFGKYYCQLYIYFNGDFYGHWKRLIIPYRENVP